MKRFATIILALGLALGCGSLALAKDMDDKIDRDDGFDFDNTLKKGTNVKYEKVKAKSKAKRDQDGGSVDGGSGDTNINSAVVGGNVYGDIVIIDEGKGNKNVVKK